MRRERQKKLLKWLRTRSIQYREEYICSSLCGQNKTKVTVTSIPLGAFFQVSLLRIFRPLDTQIEINKNLRHNYCADPQSNFLGKIFNERFLIQTQLDSIMSYDG